MLRLPAPPAVHANTTFANGRFLLRSTPTDGKAWKFSTQVKSGAFSSPDEDPEAAAHDRLSNCG